ncbi:MAG: DUF4350 domain-containing protein [Firmicutes bacterium]|nr:DUF4350 domain-containing protein [Bacillota bacterium]
MSRLSVQILLLGIAGCLIVLLLTLIPTPPQAKPYPDFWTNSPAPGGTKAFYNLLARQTIPVMTWKQPVQMLPAGSSRSLMIMVEPSFEFESKEIERWRAWMEKGNSLWLLVDYPDSALPFTVSSANQSEAPVDKAGTDSTPAKSSLIQVKGLGALAGDYSLAVNRPDRLQTGTKDQVLLADQKGVLAFTHRYGKGELIVCQGAAWMQNQNILQGDHLRILLAMAEGGLAEDGSYQRIWFNEYIHGQSVSTNFWGAFPLWMPAFASACCLWLLFELWRRGLRFGPAEIPRADQIRLPDERIRALAAWYEQKGFYAAALTAQADYLRQRLAERWGVAPENDWPRLENILRRKLERQEVDQYLEVYQKISPSPGTGWPASLSQRDFVAWSRRLSMMQEVVEQQ